MSISATLLQRIMKPRSSFLRAVLDLSIVQDDETSAL